MKFGVRKPSLTKSLKARTTAKYKRKVKKALIPGYGKKGMGWAKNPRNFLIWVLLLKKNLKFKKQSCLNKIKNPPKLWTARADLNYKIV